VERKDFFTTSAGSAAFICIGEFAACAKSSMNSGGSISPFNIDLSSRLNNVGDSVVNGNVIAICTAEGDMADSFVALNNICTHQGCTANFNSSQGDLEFPCYGARFNIHSGVIHSPASTALKKYSATITDSIRSES